ncbi:MAG TPA: META domain-containing protein [Xanthomonadaceae bacterium]|nr:META domain-containing protein [Xanthomonadaceae bacterium]
MRSLHPVLLPVLVLGLGACAERTPEPAVPDELVAIEPPAETTAEVPLETVSYRCGDLEVEARFYREGAVLVIGDQEHALSQVLSASGARYASGSDPADVELWAKGPEAMLTLHGTRYPTCHESGSGGGPATPLQGGEWRLTALEGEAVPGAPEITLVFFADGQVAGRGGCNSYSGRYTLSGEGLSVGPIAATKMMCLDEGVMAREAHFLDILGKAARFYLDDEGRLHIETADGRSLLASLDVG